MKTISLLHGDDFNNNIFEEIRDSKNFVFDYSSSKILQKYGIDSFHADEFLTKLERDEIFDHVVSKLYWFKNE